MVLMTKKKWTFSDPRSLRRSNVSIFALPYIAEYSCPLNFIVTAPKRGAARTFTLDHAGPEAERRMRSRIFDVELPEQGCESAFLSPAQKTSAWMHDASEPDVLCPTWSTRNKLSPELRTGRLDPIARMFFKMRSSSP